MAIRRFDTNPIIRPHMDDRMGSNVNGPSLIRVPDWVESPLGKYYLYFGHHQGDYIRLAYAADLAGPWTMHRPGVLDLADSHFLSHVASPDLIVLEQGHEIRMYYHGCGLPDGGPQAERVAVSSDGLHFTAREEILGRPYWCVFWWDGYWYGFSMRGLVYRSEDGLTAFEEGPDLGAPNMRHPAVKLDRDVLTVLYSVAFDCPEHLVMSTVKLTPNWLDWQLCEPVTVLEPEMDYEGAGLPLEPSRRGAIHEAARQLRDPCIFEEGGRTYLLYSVAGEQGIAIAEWSRDER